MPGISLRTAPRFPPCGHCGSSPGSVQRWPWPGRQPVPRQLHRHYRPGQRTAERPDTPRYPRWWWPAEPGAEARRRWSWPAPTGFRQSPWHGPEKKKRADRLQPWPSGRGKSCGSSLFSPVNTLLTMNHIAPISNDFSISGWQLWRLASAGSGAIDSAAAVHADLFQGGGTFGAGVAAATVHQQGLGKVARFAVAVHEVAQGGAAHQNGCAQGFANGFSQFVVTVQGNTAGFPFRVDAGFEQGFIGVDVAHADHNVVVHNERLDGRLLAPGQPEQPGPVECI